MALQGHLPLLIFPKARVGGFRRDELQGHLLVRAKETFRS